MVLDSYSLVDFYMYVFGTIILYEITLKLCKNDLLNLCDQFGIFSVNTKTEPKIPKPNFSVSCSVSNSQEPKLPR